MLRAFCFRFQLFHLFSVSIFRTDCLFSVSWSVFFPFPNLGGLRGRGPGPYPGTPGQTCISGILTSLNFLVEIWQVSLWELLEMLRIVPGHYSGL